MTPSGETTTGRTDDEVITSVVASPDRHGVSSCLSFTALTHNYGQLHSHIPAQIRTHDPGEVKQSDGHTWRQVLSPPIDTSPRTRPHTIASTSASASIEGLNQLATHHETLLQTVPTATATNAKLTIEVPIGHQPLQSQTQSQSLAQHSLAQQTRDWHLSTVEGASCDDETKEATSQRVIRRPSIPLALTLPMDAKKSKSMSQATFKACAGFVPIDSTDESCHYKSKDHRCVLS